MPQAHGSALGYSALDMVLIARAAATGCPTLVLDEPATGLDLKNQVRVLSLLRGLMADGGTTRRTIVVPYGEVRPGAS